MKRVVFILFFILLITGCQTQEEIKQKKLEEEINKINNELSKNEIPKETREWIVNSKTSKTATVFCISTSKKCAKLKDEIESIDKEIKNNVYYIELDTIDEDSTNVYKTTFELIDYTSYLPYVSFVNKGEFELYKSDNININEIIDYIKVQ